MAGLLLAGGACRGDPIRVAQPAEGAPLSDAAQRAIADTLTGLIASAYDFANRTDVVDRIMHLYPDSGPVISASAGRIIASRDSVAAVIRHFWETTGVNMREPRWEWGDVYVDVLAPDAAVMTATYRIPHYTPTGAPHVVAGAWTAAWVKQHGRWVIIQEHLSDLPAPPTP
jgi:ketosteroid isomerase-like protein